jgi:hypothetical protein
LKHLLKWFYFNIRNIGESIKIAVTGRPNPNEAILLAGSGRSGTTWLADLLCTAPRIQQIYEPTHPTFISSIRTLTGYDTRDPYIRSYYINPVASDIDWYKFWHDVLVGKIRNHWTDRSRTSWFPSRYLVKLIRANLMLGYVYDHFQPYIIYLLRHPCAVVYSRLNKVNPPWHADIADILSQEQLVEDHLRPWLKQIESEKDQIGAHAVWWAVENRIAQKHLEQRKHYCITYEALSIDPVNELEKICTFSGINDSSIDTTKISTPSRMATPGTFIPSSTDRLSEWKKGFSRSEQNRIIEWGHRLGITQYNDHILPISIQKSSPYIFSQMI